VTSCFAVVAPGLQPLAAAELGRLGITAGPPEPGGVPFEATPRELYAANLELRTAGRILVRIAEFPARAFYELERKAKRVPWEDIVAPGIPVRFQVTSKKSKLYHNEAIAERLRTAVSGERSAVSGKSLAPEDDAAEQPEQDAQLFVVRVFRDIVTISADSSGVLLHRRGYRLDSAKAPLRETLAAAVLLGAGYDGTVPLVDPFCGSGTIPIEAALLARRIAPGLGRRFAFEQWPSFDPAVWRTLKEEAVDRILITAPAAIVGSDRDQGAIAAARGNAGRAGVEGDVLFTAQAISSVTPPATTGLLATNPPYGVRVGKERDLRDLYARFGALARERWKGWSLAMVTAGEMPEREMQLPFETRWESSNGGIPIRLLVRP
jgi:putative N6-adenine-specific DNA methylase